MKKRAGHVTGRIAALASLCLILCFVSACAESNGGEGLIVCNDDAYTSYPDAVSGLLPDYTVTRAENNAFSYLEQGAVVEVFDAQAVPALEAGLAKYWYPQYLATVVVAVDLERTDARIRGWRDLLAADTAVGFGDSSVNRQLLMAAMAYGLEGGEFTLNEAARLLAALRSKGRLVRNSFQPPIVICYDYQAAALARQGRSIEIVVPEEGTLSYEKGLLSNWPLVFEGDIDTAMLSAGLRPVSAADDERAPRVTDYGHLNAVCQNVVRVLRRTVFRVRLFSSADGREHQFVALMYMLLVAIWTAAILKRAMQKGVRRAAFLTGLLLLGWMALRLIKYQLIFATWLNRYLWYGFYLFQLALPLVLLWLAWTIDQPEGMARPPKWMRAPAIAGGALAALVFTNDLHNWVFTLDLSNPNWDSEYGYGAGYYIVMTSCVAMVVSAIAIMLLKSGQSPRRRSFAYPLAFCALPLAYGLCYILRVPFALESDFTMTVGLFTLLFMEAAMRSGMIPVNSKYTLLFTHSPLAMQIADNEGRAALSSAPDPLRQDENALQFTAPIAGGHVLWQEDIGALNRLHKEVEASVRKLTAANALLAEQERIRRAVDEENARTLIMSQLEAEIAACTARLSAMLGKRESAARIMLLLCYIKRRCNLFFRERETREDPAEGLLPADELMAYIDELAELAGYAGVKIMTINQMTARADLRRATLFCDFFYNAADWAAGCACSSMLTHLGPGQALRLLFSGDAGAFRTEDGLAEAIARAGGTVTIKALDDSVGVSLAFPENEI
ncbi:MAG: ABC transporter substrate-binding protein [Oscillospiraceae bacterium]|nr:ABC transporter substrate-binding protein [Oscillospiraceae bacterium]